MFRGCPESIEKDPIKSNVMKKSFFSILLLLLTGALFAQTPQDSLSLATAAWRVTDLGGGAQCRYAQVDLFGSRQSISVVTYPARRFTTHLVHLDREARITSELGREAQAEIAINGGYFNVKSYEPVTFVLLDRKVVGHTTPEELMRTNGVIAFRDKRGHEIDIFRCDTADYPRVARSYRSALAAGPVLVESGKIATYQSERSFYTGRHPRSLIGKRTDGTVVLIVIDGRFKGQGDGTTIAQTAYIAYQLGLHDALNLDGGGSSTLWTAREGVLNHPYDNHRFDHAGERAVPNCLVVKSSGR